MFGGIHEISENPKHSQGFSPAWELSQTLPGFHQAMKAPKTCSISFIKLSSIELTKRKKEKDDIQIY